MPHSSSVCCSLRRRRLPSFAMPSTLRVRNLTSSAVRITLSARFPAPPADPAPITPSNITNVSNLSANLTRLLRGRASTTGPSAEQLAAQAQRYEEAAIDLTVAPYAAADCPPTVAPPPPSHVLRLEFATGTDGACKFRVDLAGDGSSGRVEVAVAPLGDVGSMRLSGVWHAARGVAALISTASLEAWMSALPDTVGLAALSVPGTHNSPTHHRALPSVRCQAVPVRAQLDAGVRFLDVRVQVDAGDLALVHGAFPIALGGRKLLAPLLQHVYDFLDAHPSECVIISLKREGRGDADDDDFARRVKSDVLDRAPPDRWFTLPRIPTLGEARGRCILFRRYAVSVPELIPLGFDAHEWTYNTPNDTTSDGRLCVQDFCEVLETENIDRKISYVKDQLERSAEGLAKTEADNTPCPLFLNFLSASNFWKVGCWPDRIAAKINPAVVEWLACDHRVDGGRGDTGVVVCDFVGEDGDWTLCRLIVGMNGGLVDKS